MAVIATVLWVAATFVFLWIALTFGGWLAWGLFLATLGGALWCVSGAAAARTARQVDRVRAALLAGDAVAQVIASRAGISIGRAYAAAAALERSGDVVSHVPEQREGPNLPPRRVFALTRAGKMRAGNTPVPIRLGRH